MLVILLVVAALGIAACGSDEEPSAGPAQSTAATETQAAEPAAAETKPEAAATEPSDGHEGRARRLGVRRRCCSTRSGRRSTSSRTIRRARPSATASAPRPGRPSTRRASRGRGEGVKDSLLGTVKRRDGRLQVTYAGKPLYFYVHEGPGEVRCHNVNLNGGLWWVVGAGREAASREAPARWRRCSRRSSPRRCRAGGDGRARRSRARGSEFGTMLWGPNRQAVYVFERDGREPSRCYGSARGPGRPSTRRASRVAGRGVRSVAARHDAPPRRPAPGDLRRQAALLLRARGARRGALPQREPQRRPVVGRGAERQAPALTPARRLHLLSTRRAPGLSTTCASPGRGPLRA